MKTVVLTGSECTGKTTLAAALARRYGAVWVPEAARTYAEMKGTPLDAADVEPIARDHVAASGVARLRATRLLVLDTDLVSTVVYARHYYGSCPAWIEAAARERRADLYLFHHADVPWLPDAARDRGHRRDEVHALFAAVLEEVGARSVDVSGGWEEREARAVSAIDALLKSQ